MQCSFCYIKKVPSKKEVMVLPLHDLFQLLVLVTFGGKCERRIKVRIHIIVKTCHKTDKTTTYSLYSNSEVF